MSGFLKSLLVRRPKSKSEAVDKVESERDGLDSTLLSSDLLYPLALFLLLCNLQSLPCFWFPSSLLLGPTLPGWTDVRSSVHFSNYLRKSSVYATTAVVLHVLRMGYGCATPSLTHILA